MESPGHKKNILSPEFNKVGIGVTYKKNQGYYITQDFTLSPDILNEIEARKIILKKINNLRQKNSLPSLALSEKAEKLAHELSKRMVKGEDLPRILNTFLPPRIIFITAASLEIGDTKLEKTLNKFFSEIGIGVRFDKNSDYPGGAYFITIVLFFKKR